MPQDIVVVVVALPANLAALWQTREKHWFWSDGLGTLLRRVAIVLFLLHIVVVGGVSVLGEHVRLKTMLIIKSIHTNGTSD